MARRGRKCRLELEAGYWRLLTAEVSGGAAGSWSDGFRRWSEVEDGAERLAHAGNHGGVDVAARVASAKRVELRRTATG